MTRFHPLASQRLRFGLLFLLGLTLCLMLNLGAIVPNRALAQSPATAQLVQQGIDAYAAGQFSTAIARWEAALSQTTVARDRAVIQSNLAQAYRQLGKRDRAIQQWEQAIQFYQAELRQSRKNSTAAGQLAELQIEQAQTYSELGQHERAVTLLQATIELARQVQNPKLEAATWGSLGNAYWALGEYESALTAQQTSLTIARQLNDATYISTALNNLGNVLTTRSQRYQYQVEAARLEGDTFTETELTKVVLSDTQKALDTYRQSVEVSRSLGGLAEAKALLNLNRLLQKLAHQKSAPANRPMIAANRDRILTLLRSEPASQEKAYLLIGVANSVIDDAQMQQGTVVAQAEPLLQEALQVAQTIQDERTISFAVGTLGHLYELQTQYDTALQLTRQAQFSAQQVSAADSLYRWYWQQGRLLQAKGEIQPAISAYEQAIAALQSIRSDIIAANQDVQFDFRDSVEPIYRELIGLLLSQNVPTADRTQTKSIIRQTPPEVIGRVLDTLELLKLAELQNFFGDDCVQVAQAIVNQERTGLGADPNAAVIYSIVLRDRTELILRLPNGTVKNYQIALNAEALQAEVDTFRNVLERRATDEYLPHAQKLYQRLIAPIDVDLATVKPKTLVFIHDGVLRKVPMSALHDGQQFLIQKFPIAVTPSLSLTTRQPLNRANLNALILGLTVEQPPFSALVNVATETDTVQKILGGTELLDRAFTLDDVRSQLEKNSYPIIHMATHGKFGADSESTFLLGYESRITIKQLDTVLRTRRRQPVELLTLSACQTAAGDNRSALGIAGVAVRAGVKSALASLWFINDESTVPLIGEFYTQLRQPGTTKAEALRQAQIKLITEQSYRDYNHPSVWSPFILIGNWL